MNDESTASVSLDADVNPFEKGMDKANTIVAGWTQKTESRFASMAAAVEAKSAGLVASLAKFADKGGDEIGGALGSKIGMAAGAMLGGPAGAIIGRTLGKIGGEELSGLVDFEGITKSLNDLAQGVKPLSDQFKQNWVDMKSDAADAFDTVKDLVKGLDLKGLLKGEAGAWDDFQNKAQQAWDAIGGFGDKVAFRFEETLDSIWEAVRQPLAKVADWTENLLKGLGLVDESTQSWGDSLLEVQKIGEQALGALGYGFGYLEGLFKKAGGYALEYFGLPLQQMFAKVLEGLSTLIRGLNQLAEDAGIGKFEWVDKLADGLDAKAAKMQATLGETLEKARELQNIDPNARGKQQQNAFIGAGNRGQTSVESDRAAEAWTAIIAAIEAENAASAEAWNEIWDSMEKPIDKLGNASNALQGGVSAMIAGSQQAANAIAQSRNEAANRSAQMADKDAEVRAAATKTADNTEDAAGYLEEIAAAMADQQVLLVA